MSLEQAMNFADNAGTSDDYMRSLLVARPARGLTRGAAPLLGVILALVLVASGSADDLPPSEKLFEQGVKAFGRGAFEEAASSWSSAASAYERERKPSGRMTALVPAGA